METNLKMKKHMSFLLILCLIFLFFHSELNASTSLTYEYDANGNLIQGDGKYYEYNDANQLVKVRHGDATGTVLAEYVYDYTGQRIKKVDNAVTTYYIEKHFEKQVSNAGSANTSYYFANGERVAKKDSLGNIYYYHLDHLGGTNIVTDSTGNLVERIKYYPFGEIREGGNEKYSFTGKEKDKLTDFYYFEARYYNPEFKHFTQADTALPDIYNPQNLNRYSYVVNNPFRFIDPNGHSAIGTNEWNIEFAKARTEDRAKFEAMKKQYQTWVSHGGVQAIAQLAYQKEMIKGYDLAITEVEIIKMIADSGVTVLSAATGPFGSMVGVGYDAVNTFIEMSPRYVFGSPKPHEIERDVGTIALRTFGHLGSSIAGKGLKGIPEKVSYNASLSIIMKPSEFVWNAAHSNQTGLIISGPPKGAIYNQGGYIGFSGIGVQPGQYLRLDGTIR